MTVFVGGVQRSGTNMVMDVLERSALTDVFREGDPRAFQDFQMRPRDVIHALVAASPAPRVVIKALCELQELRALMDDFDPARTLWVVRRYDDMINSHMKKWRGCPKVIGSIIEDRDAAGWRGRGMSPATRDVLIRHYRPDIGHASAVALFWYLRNILFFEQGFDTDPRVLVIRYESLVTDPARAFRRAFAFLDTPFEPRLTQAIFASSVGKEAAPEVEPEIRALCDGLVRRFEPLMGS